MVEATEHVVAVGARVRIRSVRPAWTPAPPAWLKLDDDPEAVVAIVPAGQEGRFRLSPRTPLARALLGRRAGDVVAVSVEAGTVQFEVLAIEPALAANGHREVRVGDVVRVQDGDLEEWWRIVPHHEADALRRWISEAAPLARAVLGRQAGEVVQVEGPGGRRWPVTILAVEAVACG